MDQDATWYGGRPRPRQHCVRWGPSSPLKGHTPNFQPMSAVGKCWMNQDATWYGSRPRASAHTPLFLAHVYCGQTVAHLSYC